MIWTQEMTPCTIYLGTIGVVGLIISIATCAIAVAMPQWISLTTGHVGLFQWCIDGISDCYDLDMVYTGEGLYQTASSWTGICYLAIYTFDLY